MDFGPLIVLLILGFIAWALLRSKPGPAMVCTNCGHFGKTSTRTRGSILIEIVLWLCFIIPGIIYSLWRLTTRRRVCSACGNENTVPADTPVGRKLLAEHSQAPKA